MTEENSKNETAHLRVETKTGRDYDARSGEPTPGERESKFPPEVIAIFEERWPACFAVYAVRRRPLKIGIHFEVIAALSGIVSEADIRRALGIYTSNIKYLKKQKAGRGRFGLDGMPDGKVTERNEAYAKWRISSHYLSEWRRQNQSWTWRKLDPNEDPNGKWASRRHPGNANKPRLSLKSGRR
jgi:sRNA-binding protein